MTEIRERAMRFEGIVLSKKHDKRGYVVSIAVHPDEIPVQLLRDLIGSRYMCAMVKLGDDDQPILPEDEGSRALRLCHALCRDETFQQWLFKKYGPSENPGPVEEQIKGILAKTLNMESRAEIKETPEVRERFLSLVDDYRAAKRTGKEEPWN